MSEKTYQMLWDCKYCGQKKNLGLTHRHCPSCGAPQDANARYFPPDSEKVAVEDHPFVGADVICPACNTASSRAAKCCGNCGGPLGAGKDVRIVEAPVAAPPPAKKKFNPAFVIVPIVLVLIVISGLFFLLRKRSGSFVVDSVSWERTVDVERNDMTRDSAWCDSVPTNANVLGRHQEQRSTKQIPDGQTCTTKKKDLGNGTYKEVEECQPKFKSEPVYDQKCDYEAPRWKTIRTAKANGVSNPAWPATEITKPGACLGCEREGARKETYTISLSEPSSGKKSSCTVDAARFASFSTGARYDGKIGAVTGSIDCDSLVAR